MTVFTVIISRTAAPFANIIWLLSSLSCEKIGTLCSRSKQKFRTSLNVYQFYIFYTTDLFVIKLLCWCTITNNNQTEYKPSGHILIVAMWCTILLGTQQGIFSQNDKDVNLFIVVWLYGGVVGDCMLIFTHIYINVISPCSKQRGQWNWLHIQIIVTSGESWCVVLKHCCPVSVNCFQLHARILRKGNSVREDWMTYPEYETETLLF